MPFLDLTLSDLASLFCSVVSLVVAIVIAVLQMRQSHCIDALTANQIENEEKRYLESVEIEARRFLSKYHADIGFLPLCAIAFVYDKNRPYVREMYSEFRLLSRDVRSKLFERCGWTMCDVDTDDFFSDCMEYLRQAIEMKLSHDSFQQMFYDNGKYVRRALLRYASEKCVFLTYREDNELSDIVVEPFRLNNSRSFSESVVLEVSNRFGFCDCEEAKACQIACLTAKYLAIYGSDYSDVDVFEYFGCPGSWNGERIETMEDLFLLTLFEVWSNLWPHTFVRKVGEKNVKS